jgi:hypothetical protein
MNQEHMPVPETPADEKPRKAVRDLYERAKALLKEANARRVVVRAGEKEPILRLPLTVCVIGGLIASPAVIIGAVAALVAGYAISVEKDVERGDL